MSRRAIVLGSVALAAAVAAALIAVFAFRSSPAAPASTVSGAARVDALLHGIPQRGTELGSPSAPVTLVEFADPQCPYCAEWARNALPELVDRYVRPGRVRVVFVGMAFLGPDSGTALRTALAAGRQSRFWNVLELLFENQGPENTGWVTESLLRGIGDSVPGLDTGRMLADRTSSSVEQDLRRADATARASGVSSTPSFGLGPTGGKLRLVQVTSLTPSGIEPAIDAALKQ